MSELIKKTKNLILKIPQNEFAKIILDFLGRKKIFSRTVKADFCISIEDIKQFHYLIDQKVEKEESTQLSIFSATIRYEDGYAIVMESFEELEKYHEQRNVIPKSITIDWSIVIQFPNSETVETQKISVTISKYDHHGVTEGEFYYTVEHTNQAWGFEVSSLLDSQIKKLCPRKKMSSKVYEFIAKYFLNWESYKNFMIFMAILATGWFLYDLDAKEESYLVEKRVEIQRIENSLEELKQTIPENGHTFILNELYRIHEKEQITKVELDKAINYLKFTELEEINTNEHILVQKKMGSALKTFISQKTLLEATKKKLTEMTNKYSFDENAFVLIKKLILQTGLLLTIWPFLLIFDKYYSFYFKEKSFILITEEEKKAQETYLYKKKKGFALGVATFCFSITGSLIASFLYAIL